MTINRRDIKQGDAWLMDGNSRLIGVSAQNGTESLFVRFDALDPTNLLAPDDSTFIAPQLPQATGWRDMLAPLSAAGVPPSSAPVMTAFVVGTVARREYAFDVNDLLYVQPFHVDHDVKPGGKGYLHVHWTTNGTSTATVKWEFQIARALGHDQANFAQVTTVTVEQAAAGTAYRHMVTEVSDANALTLTEPDELILVTIKRITNGGTNNTDTVFGLMVDIHYETDRGSTPNKAPNFYA
jgi:hypothetical protein